MITTPTNTSRDQYRPLPRFVRRRMPWDVLILFVIYGLVVIVAGYWLRQTDDTSAAYKAYHLAKFEFGQGRASLDDVCAASRRCCIAQCNVPRFSISEPLQAHLARIEALRPGTAAATAGEKSAPRNIIGIWQTHRDEAALWVRRGKPN